MGTGEKRNPRETKGTEEEDEKGFKCQWNVSNTWKSTIFTYLFIIGVYFGLFFVFDIQFQAISSKVKILGIFISF